MADPPPRPAPRTGEAPTVTSWIPGAGAPPRCPGRWTATSGRTEKARGLSSVAPPRTPAIRRSDTASLKGIDLSTHNGQDLDAVSAEPDSRPRETLDRETPAERFA
ncbi:hypothetical protein GCM10027294_01500 [Marinactinospora endophytica]